MSTVKSKYRYFYSCLTSKSYFRKKKHRNVISSLPSVFLREIILPFTSNPLEVKTTCYCNLYYPPFPIFRGNYFFPYNSESERRLGFVQESKTNCRFGNGFKISNQIISPFHLLETITDKTGSDYIQSPGN